MLYKNVKQIYSLLNQLSRSTGLDVTETKERMALEVSFGRTDHLRELTDTEFRKLIDSLSEQLKTVTPPGDRIRKSIMSMCYTMNLIRNEMSNTEKLQTIDKFIMDHSKIGNKKPLMKYDVKELNKLHHQFEVFTKYYLSKL